MSKFKRIAVADRSALANNIYATLLKPEGFSLFSFKTIKAMMENLNWKWGPGLFLINTNTFASPLEKILEWFSAEKRMREAPKIFLCEPEEDNISAGLKKLPNSFVLFKPFFPPELTRVVEKFFRGVV